MSCCSDTLALPLIWAKATEFDSRDFDLTREIRFLRNRPAEI